MIDAGFTVTVPWRTTPTRAPLFEALTNWYKEHMGLDIFAYDSPQVTDDLHKHQRYFNTAASRNYCVEQSPTEIVVINDADTIPNKDALIEAIEYVKRTGQTCLPYTRYNIVNYEATRKYLDGEAISPRSCTIYAPAVGGILVTTKTMWNLHNGQDERMFGWGYQDTAWHTAYETLIGEMHRIDGDIYSLTHKLAERGANIANNRSHFQRYLNAKGNIDAMASLVSGNRLPRN
jgi:predicted glycosyltransferase involved in capsule biosynthesis